MTHSGKGFWTFDSSFYISIIVILTSLLIAIITNKSNRRQMHTDNIIKIRKEWINEYSELIVKILESINKTRENITSYVIDDIKREALIYEHYFYLLLFKCNIEGKPYYKVAESEHKMVNLFKDLLEDLKENPKLNLIDKEVLEMFKGNENKQRYNKYYKDITEIITNITIESHKAIKKEWRKINKDKYDFLSQIITFRKKKSKSEY